MTTLMSKVPAALLGLAVLAACGGDNRNYSPTAPPIPAAQPTPTPQSSSKVIYFLSLRHDSEMRSPEAQILIDDIVLFSGPMFTGSPWDDGPTTVSGSLESLPAGRHTVTLEITRQDLSPDTYRLTAIVNLGTQQLGSWHEPVTLATGGAWTGEFELD